MAGQDLTSDRPQPPVVVLVDEAAALLVGRPGAGKTSALAAQIAAKGHRIGMVVTHSKARPVVAVVDDGVGLPDLTHLPARDTQAWTRAVREHAAVLADRACRAPGDGAVSQ